MKCGRCYECEATRYVHLSSSVVSITRAFCENCAKLLCTTPVAGATASDGVREPLIGTDLGPIGSEN